MRKTMQKKHWLCALAALAALSNGAATASAAGPAGGEWDFRVLLDDSPIGEHRFALATTGGERKLVSEARFAVKLLGVTVYRYRHEATELWRGDCLARLLNAQSGKIEPVRISKAGSGTVEVRGQPVEATRWRIATDAQPIDVWYSQQGEWLGLDSTVGGNRKLSYRLK